MNIEYKAEDLKLMNQKGGIFIGNTMLFDWENEFSRQDKIDFMDKYFDGIAGYMLSLIEKYKTEIRRFTKR